MKRLLVVAGLAIVAVGGTLGGLLAMRGSGSTHAAYPPSGPYKGGKPPPGIRAPEFALQSYRGPTIRMHDLRGKVVVVTFLDTACRDKCPIIASEIGSAWRLLTPSERANTDALAITVLPQVDTSARVRMFLSQRHALRALDWLIGPVSELPKVWKAYFVLAAANSGNASVHSAGVRIFDRRGIWVSDLSVGVELTPANLAHDIRVALRAAH